MYWERQAVDDRRRDGWMDVVVGEEVGDGVEKQVKGGSQPPATRGM